MNSSHSCSGEQGWDSSRFVRAQTHLQNQAQAFDQGRISANECPLQYSQDGAVSHGRRFHQQHARELVSLGLSPGNLAAAITASTMPPVARRRAKIACRRSDCIPIHIIRLGLRIFSVTINSPTYISLHYLVVMLIVNVFDLDAVSCEENAS
jgi:hypothetical protein